MNIVIPLLLIILIGIEIAAIIGLIYILIKIKETNKKLPPIFEQTLQEMVYLREQLKDVNKRFEKTKPEPMDPLELGRVFGQLFFRMILMKKFSFIYILKILYKHKSRLSATFAR